MSLEIATNVLIFFCLFATANSVGHSIKFGSVIQLRHSATNRALYSHAYNYLHPGTSGQQQIIGVDYHDSSCYWLVKTPHGEDMAARLGQVVKDGEKIRLEHRNTGKNLHGHAIPAPVSEDKFEVSCFGVRGEGDSNDDWVVKVAEEGDWDSEKHVGLFHPETNRHLWSMDGLGHRNYTAGQQEVSVGPEKMDDNAWWTAVVMDPTNCSPDGRCEAMGAKRHERRLTIFELFDEARFSDLNKDPDNVPKEISIFCPTNPTVNINDLDYASQEEGQCMILNLSAPNFDTRLVLMCGHNKTTFDM